MRLAPQLSGRLGQRGAVRLNLPNRFNDVIHVPTIGQEQILGQPDRRRADLPVAFQLIEALAIGFQSLGAKETLEPARVDRLVAMNVYGETMTSSPASTSMTCKLTSSAVVPLAVARQRLAPSRSA